MAKGSRNFDWKGVGDARPGGGTKEEKGQGGHNPIGGDWKGEFDSRPGSGTESQSVNLGKVNLDKPTKVQR